MEFLHILKQFFISFATVYKNNTDVNIPNNMSSIGNHKNWTENYYFKVKLNVINAPFHDF